MSSGHAKRRFAQLWQLPLLVLSLGLFGYAAYLLVDSRPGLSVEQKIESARSYLRYNRPEAASEQCTRLLEGEKLTRDNEAKVHLLLAEAIEAAQKEKQLDIATDHERIVEQSEIAMLQGVKPEAEIYRRLGESYEALGRPAKALENYRRAMAMDLNRAPHLQRKVIALQLTQEDTGPAAVSIDEYLKQPKLADSERAWALGQKAQLLADRGNFIEARALLGEALRLDGNPLAQGQVNYRLGYCAWKLGDSAEAERYLRDARNQLRTHPLDADAACLLGRLCQDRDDPREAMTFFEAVLTNHPDSVVAPLARLGRATCRLALADDEAGLADLHELVNEMGEGKSREKFKAEALAGLRQASSMLSARGNQQDALEVLACEQTLEPAPSADFYARLGAVLAIRADQLAKSIDEASGAAEKIRREQQARETRTKAGDAYVAYSRALSAADDKGRGQAMWKGVDLYDRAGNSQAAISALELFVAERPQDVMAPDALLRLGRSYQAAGQLDKAIAVLHRNQVRYPLTLAASKSGVPLAQAYLAQGPDSYGKAEAALKAVVEDNPFIAPDAEEFHEGLFELAQLYYRTDRFEDSVARLAELTQRYPNDPRMGQLLFLMGDSYRKSASLLGVRLASADPKSGAASAADVAEAAAAKKDRLSKAGKLFDDVIERYRQAPAVRDPDKLYVKLSHFYRADCLYELGEYEEAIKLYDAATLRYQEDPLALAAYVQIVNSYCALGKTAEAKAANERAKWLLRRMPADAFENGRFSMPKEYWDHWLKWSNESGMF